MTDSCAAALCLFSAAAGATVATVARRCVARERNDARGEGNPFASWLGRTCWYRHPLLDKPDGWSLERVVAVSHKGAVLLRHEFDDDGSYWQHWVPKESVSERVRWEDPR